MGRPEGTKNIMRSPEEKETIVLESYQKGRRKTAQKYGVSVRLLGRWLDKYRMYGIDGLKSQTGKSTAGSKGNPLSKYQNRKHLSKEEELEFENMKLKIEVARLKKGYQVKGVGSKKEYVTIKDLNTKS